MFQFIFFYNFQVYFWLSTPCRNAVSSWIHAAFNLCASIINKHILKMRSFATSVHPFTYEFLIFSHILGRSYFEIPFECLHTFLHHPIYSQLMHIPITLVNFNFFPHTPRSFSLFPAFSVLVHHCYICIKSWDSIIQNRICYFGWLFSCTSNL